MHRKKRLNRYSPSEEVKHSMSRFLMRYKSVGDITASYCSLNIEIILVEHSDWLHD